MGLQASPFRPSHPGVAAALAATAPDTPSVGSLDKRATMSYHDFAYNGLRLVSDDLSRRDVRELYPLVVPPCPGVASLCPQWAEEFQAHGLAVWNGFRCETQSGADPPATSDPNILRLEARSDVALKVQCTRLDPAAPPDWVRDTPFAKQVLEQQLLLFDWGCAFSKQMRCDSPP